MSENLRFTPSFSAPVSAVERDMISTAAAELAKRWQLESDVGCPRADWQLSIMVSAAGTLTGVAVKAVFDLNEDESQAFLQRERLGRGLTGPSWSLRAIARDHPPSCMSIPRDDSPPAAEAAVG